MNRRAQYPSIVLLVFACASCSSASFGPPAPPLVVTPGTFVVEGDLPRTGPLTPAELEPYAVDIEWEDQGDRHRYHGIPLDTLLAQLGFPPGYRGSGVAPADTLTGWRLVVVATADDGYQAVFSTAELIPD